MIESKTDDEEYTEFAFGGCWTGSGDECVLSMESKTESDEDKSDTPDTSRVDVINKWVKYNKEIGQLYAASLIPLQTMVRWDQTGFNLNRSRNLLIGNADESPLLLSSASCNELKYWS